MSLSLEIIEKYIQEKNLEYKLTGNQQINLKVCPSCGDSKWTHCYMGIENGLWSCFKCEAKGNFNQFRALFGDGGIDLSAFLQITETGTQAPQKTYTKPQKDIEKEYAVKLLSLYPEHLNYLKSVRKLEDKTIQHFRLGSTGEKISIPIYENGELVNIRYRQDPRHSEGAKYTQERGCRTVLFNGDILEDENPETIYLTEGEFDAMQLWQRGYTAVLSTTLGAGNFPDEWVKRLENVKNIFLVYDNDEDGQEGALKVAEKLGRERCKNIILPKAKNRTKTDVTNFFVDDGFSLQDFETLVKTAKTISEKDIIHIGELAEKMRDMLLNGQTYGLTTGFQQLDEIVGGFRNGRLIVLSGLTSTGKSSFSTCLSLNIAKFGKPVLIFSLEMPAIDLVKKFFVLETRLTNADLKTVADPSPQLTAIDDALTYFKGDTENPGVPLYFYKDSGMIKLEVLRGAIEQMKKKYGCSLVVIDHLHYFQMTYNNVTQETSKIVRHIKKIAIDLDLPILLLAHLNRGGRSQQRKGLYIPALSDLRDCFTGDTEIYDFRTETVKTLEELEKSKEKCSVSILDKTGKKMIVNNIASHKTGKKDVYEFILKNGIRVRATDGSKLYKLTGWVKGRELNKGDYVAYSLPTNRYDKKAIKYDLNFLSLIGLLLSDGSIDAELCITTNDKEIVDFIEKVAEANRLRIRTRNRFNAYMVSLAKDHNEYRNHFKDILKQLGLFGTKSKTKFIPNEFKQLSQIEICSLLRGLYQGDGCYTGHSLKYSSISKQLLADIQYLWKLLGFNSSINISTKAGRKCNIRGKEFVVDNIVYDLILSNHEATEYFYQNIGFMGEKQKVFLKNYKPRTQKYNRMSKLPPEIIDILLTKKGKASWREFGYRIQTTGNKYKLPSKSIVARIAHKLGDSDLARIANMDIEFSEIIEKKYLGKMDTYDLDVPIHHHFFLENGLLVHNSGTIEQDADQVIFVCRDSENNKKEERQKAIIKIAKNRDGQAGRSVSMLYEEDISYFEEMMGVDYTQNAVQDSTNPYKRREKPPFPVPDQKDIDAAVQAKQNQPQEEVNMVDNIVF